jgi:ribosomal protein S18 acetylase RimI-like enzyme
MPSQTRRLTLGSDLREPPMIDIRPAQLTDIPLLRQVAIQTQIDTFGAQNEPEHMEAFLNEAYSIEKFELEFSEPRSQYYIAWSDEQLAGFMRVRVTDEAEAYLGKNAIELQRLYVSKDFQGKKIGLMLMQKTIDHAWELKFEWLWLGVWERNFKAQEFYKKIGFERFSEHTFWMGPDPQVDWLMKLKL